ncbi:MAG: DUF3987 domain-containing protein [Oligoflexales bacterium]
MEARVQNHEKNGLECAFSFAKRGWPVLPLHYPLQNGECSCGKKDCSRNGKHPMTKNGLKDATSGSQLIQQWWMKSPKANVGILTGKASGLVVLDVDPRHGGDQSLLEIEQEFGSLPSTLKVKTGGQGWHYYFKHPGTKISNKTNIRPGLDIRGDGGYVVAPPSKHASLQDYKWVENNAEIADLPLWLYELIVGNSYSNLPSKTENPGFAPGCRNSSLTSVAGFLRNKGLDSSAIANALEALNEKLCDPPLPKSELAQILKSNNRYKEAIWPDPIDLPEKVIVPEMSEAMLPDVLRNWCVDIADRMQVPLEFVAGPSIVAIAAMIGRKIVVCPKSEDDWQIVPNLWGCLIAPPGSMKSPAMSAVLKPIQQLAVKAREDFLSENKRIQSEKVVAKAEIDALKDALKSAVKQGNQTIVEEKKQQLTDAVKAFDDQFEIVSKRFMMNDPTIEKLLTILEENPQGLLLYRDELGGWIETMYKSGREGDREFFLESWNGDTPYSMDRVGRGSVFVDGLCLSVLGGLQPKKFESYVSSVVKGGKSDDGLLQRFQILLFPDKKRTWKRIDRKPNSEAVKNIDEIFEKIAQIPNPKREDGQVNRFYVRFSGSAQVLFNNWMENHENRLLRSMMSHLLESHLSKYRSLMPSLALIFSVIDSFGRGDSLPLAIDENATKRAIEWCSFLEKHARKSYGDFLEPETVSGRLLLRKIQSGAVKDYDRCRDIYRHGWKGLASLDELSAAIQRLSEHGWVRTEMLSPPTGRRYEVLRIHPSLRLAQGSPAK